MKKQFYKYFSVVMAMIILTSSVGVTRTVHYCAMHHSTACDHQEKGGCQKKVATQSCCERKKAKQIASCISDANQKSCCIDKKQTFSYSPSFVSKISKPDFKLSVTSELSFVLFNDYVNPSHIYFIDFSQSHSPPLLSGREVLMSKHILNV